MTLEQQVQKMASRACQAAARMSQAGPSKKSDLLRRAAGLIHSRKGEIAEANRKDLVLGKKAGLSRAMLDRLTLTPARISAMAQGLVEVARQKDPVGQVQSRRKRPNGLVVSQVRVPLGTVLIIYESRPNVTIDSAALCVKSGNAVILRGGKEAAHSNRALVKLFRQALAWAKLPEDCVQLVHTPDRRALSLLLKQAGEIDLVIPRGGAGLIRAVTAQSAIPVLKHYKGVCHVYIDRYAKPDMAVAIAVNAKVQRPGVCNAMETLLLDRGLSRRTIVRVLQALKDSGVILLGCPRSRRLFPGMRPATRNDYFREYLDLNLSVRIVDGPYRAMDHIRQYGSGHTEAIITQNAGRARRFLARVDSSSVMWNASTRFSDGGQYGLGAEIGISTDKIHARGPMGAYDLTTYKWVVKGRGQVRH
jgi:glutamate-5-semialdehyde dehydrogenase